MGNFELENTYTSKSDTGTSPWRFVHLTEHEGDFGFSVELNDLSLLHFVVQIVTLTGTLTDTGEDGETTMGFGNVVLFLRLASINQALRTPRTRTISS